MRKVGFVILFFLLAISTSYSQNADTTYVSSEEFEQRISVINENITNLNQQLQKTTEVNKELKSLLKQEQDKVDSLNILLGSVTGKADSLSNTVSNLRQSFQNRMNSQDEQLTMFQERMDSLSEQTSSKIASTENEIDSAKSELAGLEDETESKLSTVTANLSQSVWWISGGILFVLIVSFIGLWQLKGRFSKEQESLDERLTKKSSQLESKISELEQTNKADTKLLEVLNEKLEDMPSPSKQEEADHSIALASALEIIRMRKRIDRMDGDAKGLKSLSKALERLEDELEIKGYEIIDLEGQAYHDGMNVKADFVPDEDLAENESTITRTIKPQVNFQGKAIQHAHVQVATGTKN